MRSPRLFRRQAGDNIEDILHICLQGLQTGRLPIGQVKEAALRVASKLVQEVILQAEAVHDVLQVAIRAGTCCSPAA